MPSIQGKRVLFLICTLFGLGSFQLFSQPASSLAGIVLDEDGNALPGSHVHHEGLCCVTNWFGAFEVPGITGDSVKLSFTFIGYESLDTLIAVSHEGPIQIQLLPKTHSLHAAVVKGSRVDTLKSRKNLIINDRELLRQYDGSLMKSLDKMSGVHSMNIGAGASKPVIRGMSFNRVVVSENGIKQEGQQWGADHGLEIDAFAVESAEIVKGASAIEYGSDAIGGYIAIRNDAIPRKGKLRGNFVLTGNTGNKKAGGSLYLEKRFERLFVKSRITYQSFADYRIPTDTIVYLTRKIPVYNQRLKNTAGEEVDIHIQGGYVGEHLISNITGSVVHMKSGFFPGAHGIPSLDRVRHDGNFRDLDYPYQQVTHAKILQNNKIFIAPGLVTFDLGFQSNHRQELSLFHTHFPAREAPANNKDLELDFLLGTANANAGIKLNTFGMHTISAGMQNQWQSNRISGYSFLLPAYNSFSNGIYIQDKIRFSPHLEIHAALRYDFTAISTDSFFDDIVYDYLRSEGRNTATAESYAQRSTGLNKRYSDYSFLLGGVYTPTNLLTIRFNTGKAFRIPTAMELASNGIHHGSFRHEAGDPNLNSEKGFYADAGLEWRAARSTFILSPYGYYFPNYIFLNPTGEWSELPHSGQIYRHTQSEAILSGVEGSYYYKIFSGLTANIELEYIYNRQLSEVNAYRYPLPFTPPMNGFVSLEQEMGKALWKIQHLALMIHSKWASGQNRIARNELRTPGYLIFGSRLTGEIALGSEPVEVTLSVQNMFDTKYYNHFSFYRKLDIPEQGRTIQLTVRVPF